MTAPPDAAPLVLPRLMKVAEVARALNCSICRAYELVPHLPAGAVVRLGRGIRIREDVLAVWIAAGGTAAPTP